LQLLKRKSGGYACYNLGMIKEGNVRNESKDFKNWVIGDFREDESPFKTDKFEMKWSNRKKGYFSPAKEEGHQENKRTLGILVYGRMKIVFQDANKEALLQDEGDYYYCKPTNRHSVEALEDSLILTLRW